MRLLAGACFGSRGPGPARRALYSAWDDYVDHFGFRHKISFQTDVRHIECTPSGTYSVTLASGLERDFDAVGVANGHHWDPRWPEPPFPGEFWGTVMHSHAYVDPEEPENLVGKRVVVLGMGNSAMDIACELSRPGLAAKVYLAARRGAWIIPKYVFGKPLDRSLTVPVALPRLARQRLTKALYRLAVGKMEDFGLPTPDHDLGQAHPTISSDILVRLGSGDVTPKPNIRRLCGTEIEFTDGTRESVDALIYATGYKVSFPFFDPNLVAADDNDLPLFRRVFQPAIPNLFFFGLCQPLGAIMPIAEAQGKWVAEYLTGAYALPTPAEMRADMHAERKAMFERYVPSKRHTMQVDFDDYLKDLAKELAKGRKRAKKRMNALPIAARARTGLAL